MISHIEIRNFAIIDNLSLDFHQGFHIITGETGAGKSILIEAISMALGSRADTSLVRTGNDKAVIELTIDTNDTEAIDMLRENGLVENDAKTITFIISREIHSSGKSLCRIDGNLVSLTFLKKLCSRLADIHGQYDHQSLLNPDEHINLLDRYGEKQISPALAEVSELYNLYINTKKELDTLIRDVKERERQKDFMQFELNEINGINPSLGEDVSLAEELAILQNKELIMERLSLAYDLLIGNECSSDATLSNTITALKDIACFSEEINGLYDTILDCFYRLEDTAGEIRRLRDNAEFSEDRLTEIVQRIDLINTLKRKYGDSIENILDYKSKILDLLDKVENAETLQKDLEKQLMIRKEKLAAASQNLTILRKKTARNLEDKIMRELIDLNFKDASFSVSFDSGNEPALSPSGMDVVEFLFSSNKGEPEKPLIKIASGGEVSRIMLAFKGIIGEYDLISTLIFDEIDTGVSGITASIVGRKLLDISKRHQVICITHLAQIAAFGDHHYRIEKQEMQDRIHTTVTPLGESEKIHEIARLLGGLRITEATLNNAKELVDLSCR